MQLNHNPQEAVCAKKKNALHVRATLNCTRPHSKIRPVLTEPGKNEKKILGVQDAFRGKKHHKH